MEPLVNQARHLIKERRGNFTAVLQEALRTAPQVQIRHVVEWAVWVGKAGNVALLLTGLEEKIEQKSYPEALALLHQAMDEIHEGAEVLAWGGGVPSVQHDTFTVGHPDGDCFYPEQAFRPDEHAEDLLPQALEYLTVVARQQEEDPTGETKRLVAKAQKQIEDRLPV